LVQDSTEIESLTQKFYTAITSYIPSIDKKKLTPDYTGIRPKLSGPNEAIFKDFIIKRENLEPPLVNLIGIESPGLTSSLAIAEKVAQLFGYPSSKVL